MKQIFSILICFLFVMCTMQCGRRTPKNKYNSESIESIYSDAEISKIANEMRIVDSIFNKLHAQNVISGANLGYVVGDDGQIFFKHCYNDRGKYIDPLKCGIDSLLTQSELDTLYADIRRLKNNGIKSATFISRQMTMYYVLDVVRDRTSDGRFLCLTEKIDSSLIRGSDKEYLDSNGSLTLLGNIDF